MPNEEQNTEQAVLDSILTTPAGKPLTAGDKPELEKVVPEKTEEPLVDEPEDGNELESTAEDSSEEAPEDPDEDAEADAEEEPDEEDDIDIDEIELELSNLIGVEVTLVLVADEYKGDTTSRVDRVLPAGSEESLEI